MGTIKPYLLSLFLLPLSLALSQGSWVNISIQTDQYAGETNWEIFQEGILMAEQSTPLSNNTLTEEMILLPAGGYSFVIYDTYGDGICCEMGEGWFGLENSCGLSNYVYDFSTSQMTVFFELFPCPLPVYGCMSDEAINYNPWATVDNGSCNVVACDPSETFVSMALTFDNWPNETGFTLVDLASGEFYEQALPGEFDFSDQLSTYTYNFCVALGFELVLVDTYGDGLNGTASGGFSDGSVVITACQDSLIWELTDIAFSEQGGDTAYSGAIFVSPCPQDPPIYGCMDDDYVDYNPEATASSDCVTLHTWGCMDPEAFNYDVTSTSPDLNNPCGLVITLEDDGGDGWGNSHVGVTQGDQQWIFTVGPGEFSQSWDIVLSSDEEVDVYYFQQGGQQQSPQELEFQTLHNSVTVTNQLGDVLLLEGDNPFSDNGQGALQPFQSPEWNVYSFLPECGDTCEPYVYGCTDISAKNYNETANTEDEGCYYAAGCGQAGYLEYYTQGYEADYDDGSCEVLAVFGCTDADALNYDSGANVDNNSCVPVVIGCMDIGAANYNEEANTPDNESCLYDAGCFGEPGSPYWANDLCYSWVIEVDPYCCESAWDDVCIELYEYCGEGSPTYVIPFYSNDLEVFPNPVSSALTIRYPSQTFTEVYSSIGALVIPSTTDKVLNLSNLSKGVYRVVIDYNGRRITKNILKQ